MTFASATLGIVSHPINLLREFLDSFGNKAQAAILSWLDSWHWSKGVDYWIRVSVPELAKSLGWCRNTLHHHLNKLLEMGVIERRLAREIKHSQSWPTDTAFAYRIVPGELLKHIDFRESQEIETPGKNQNWSAGEPEMVCEETKTAPPGNQNCATSLNQNLNQTETDVTNNVCDVENLSEFEEQEQDEQQQFSGGIETTWTWEELKVNCLEIGINFPACARAIKAHSKNAINAFLATADAVNFHRDRSGNLIQGGWCKNPTGKFLAELKRGQDE